MGAEKIFYVTSFLPFIFSSALLVVPISLTLLLHKV